MSEYRERYEQVTVRSYKDPSLGGSIKRNRERGKWFVHGIKNVGADLLKITEKKSSAVEFARKRAKNVEQNGETVLIVKNLNGETSERKVYSQQTETFNP